MIIVQPHEHKPHDVAHGREHIKHAQQVQHSEWAISKNGRVLATIGADHDGAWHVKVGVMTKSGNLVPLAHYPVGRNFEVGEHGVRSMMVSNGGGVRALIHVNGGGWRVFAASKHGKVEHVEGHQYHHDEHPSLCHADGMDVVVRTDKVDYAHHVNEALRLTEFRAPPLTNGGKWLQYNGSYGVYKVGEVLHAACIRHGKVRREASLHDTAVSLERMRLYGSVLILEHKEDNFEFFELERLAADKHPLRIGNVHRIPKAHYCVVTGNKVFVCHDQDSERKLTAIGKRRPKNLKPSQKLENEGTSGSHHPHHDTAFANREHEGKGKGKGRRRREHKNK